MGSVHVAAEGYTGHYVDEPRGLDDARAELAAIYNKARKSSGSVIVPARLMRLILQQFGEVVPDREPQP